MSYQNLTILSKTRWSHTFSYGKLDEENGEEEKEEEEEEYKQVKGEQARNGK